MLIIAVVPAGYLEPVALVPSTPLCDEALDLMAARGTRRVVVRDCAGDHLLRLDEARRMGHLRHGYEGVDPVPRLPPGKSYFS